MTTGKNRKEQRIQEEKEANNTNRKEGERRRKKRIIYEKISRQEFTLMLKKVTRKTFLLPNFKSLFIFFVARIETLLVFARYLQCLDYT